MREIKFRVRDKETKKVIGYECLFDGRWAESKNGTDWQPLETNADALREQFTGLDKNKKEIYKGDIMADCYDKTEREKILKTVISEVKEAMNGNKEFLHPNDTFNGGSEKWYGGYFLEHRGTLLVDRVKKELKKTLDPHIGVVELRKYSDGEGYYDMEHYGWKVGNRTLPDVIETKEIIGNIYENPELIK